jgi:phage baseplate assembly protein W
MSGEALEVLGAPLAEIEIGAKGLRAVMQNVRTIMATWRGSVFLDRQFGIDANIIDMPLNVLHARLAMDLTQQIENYEPRVKVSSVTFAESDIENGQLMPLACVKIRDGVLL